MFAVIYIPDFSLQAALRHEPELRARPVALVDGESAKSFILQANAAAKKAGVAEGQTPSQAIARCESLTIKTRSLAQEKSATEILLQTAYGFSPNIEPTAPGVCTMELKGLGIEDHDEAGNWAEMIVRALVQYHLEARVGIAPTPELALLAAHAANPICAVRHANAFVAQLPVAALSPSPEILRILSQWGIRTVGEFLALGKNEIAERLGVEASELFERVSMNSIRPLKLFLPSEEFSEEMEFENEIETAEPLLFVLRRFVEQLSRRLETVYLVIAEFQLNLGLSSGAKYERTFKIPAPTGNIDTLFGMLQTHLETVRTDSPIVSLRLTARPAKPDTHQFGLFESTLRNPNQFAETLARLTALFGPENVGTPRPIATHKPDAFQMAAPHFDEANGARLWSKTQPQQAEFGNRGATPLAAPAMQLRRFRPPLSAHFEFREGKPALIRSEVFTGAITDQRGPFFSSGDWWEENRWQREEWDVQTSEGSLLRIYRSEEGFFVEGIYD